MSRHTLLMIRLWFIKEDNIGALNNYAYYLSVEREHLDKAEEIELSHCQAGAQTELISTHTRGLLLKGKYD